MWVCIDGTNVLICWLMSACQFLNWNKIPYIIVVLTFGVLHRADSKEARKSAHCWLLVLTFLNTQNFIKFIQQHQLYIRSSDLEKKTPITADVFQFHRIRGKKVIKIKAKTETSWLLVPRMSQHSKSLDPTLPMMQFPMVFLSSFRPLMPDKLTSFNI